MNIYSTNECMINEIGLEIFLSREDVDSFPLRKSFLVPNPVIKFSVHLKLLPPSPHPEQCMPQLKEFSAHTGIVCTLLNGP